MFAFLMGLRGISPAEVRQQIESGAVTVIDVR
jgi:hypothetical protein